MRVVAVVENWRLHSFVQDVPLFGASEPVAGVVSGSVADASLAGVVSGSAADASLAGVASVEKSSVVVASVRGLVVASS